MNTILICDDDKDIVSALDIYLTSEGYATVKAYDGLECLRLAEREPVDLILLDVMMPGLDGYTVARQVRARHLGTPILMLTARDEIPDKIAGLDHGADDYMTKPFDIGELLARVRAALRVNRYGGGSLPGGVFSAQGLTINYERRKVFVDGQEVRLTQTEYNIMAFLSVHAGKVLTYAAIIRAVWGYSDYGSVKKLQVNMKNIRKKMGVTPGEKRYIINELGVGYRMLAEDEA